MGATQHTDFFLLYEPPPMVDNMLVFDKAEFFCNRLVVAFFNLLTKKTISINLLTRKLFKGLWRRYDFKGYGCIVHIHKNKC